MKICRTCKKEKEDTAFEITTVTATKTYRHGMCYECRKVVRKVERDLKKIHGKTTVSYTHLTLPTKRIV